MDIWYNMLISDLALIFTMVEPLAWSAQGTIVVSLGDEVRHQFRKELDTNCVLVGGNGQKARCHSVILALVSSVLKKIIPDPGVDKEDTVIIIPDFGESELHRAVTLVYFGEAGFNFGEDDVIESVETFMETIGAPGLVKSASAKSHEPRLVTAASEGGNDSNTLDDMDSPGDIIGPCYDDEEEDYVQTCDETYLVDNIINPCYDEDDDVDVEEENVDKFDEDIQQELSDLGPKHQVNYCDLALASMCSKS